MSGFRKVALCFLLIFTSTQIQAYFNDGLNPVRADLSVWHQRNPRVALRTNDQLACEKPNIYICEEAPNTVPSDVGKTCNFRNMEYHEQVYRWVAGRGCLLYTPDFLFLNGSNPINLNAGCVYGNLFAPCLELVKDDGTCGCFPFDPALEEVARTVRNALVPSAHGRWEKCYYEASDCCSHFMEDVTDPLNEECQTTFDGWTCWQAAKSGTLAKAVCSEFAYSNSGPTCDHFSSKKCFDNGTWELQTDYSTCSVTPRLLRRYRFYIGMLAFSVAACLPAIFIFFFYKRLRRTARVVLHRNLLIAIVIRNVLVIVSRSEIYIDELTNSGDTVMSQHGLACRVLGVAERVAGNAVFVCMWVEGIYLHRLIVAVFRSKLKIPWLYGIGAVIAILPVVVWSTIMGLYNDHSCWIVYTIEHVQWTLDGPRILILVINTILFVDVLRVLLTKIRNTENANQLSTAKAGLFLMPVFGTQFIFTAVRPSTADCAREQVYYFVAYTLEGLQGFAVALLYCYVNREVHGLVKATYKKTESAVVSRVRGSDYPRISVEPNSERRLTYSTGLTKNNSEDKDQYTYMKPKLHVAEITSIQASERLAEILDPVYETIDNGLVNSGYDSLDRSDFDDYNFTNASSVSIGCQDWLKCTSPASSVYNNSVIEVKAGVREGRSNAEESEYENDGTYNNSVGVRDNVEEVRTEDSEYENDGLAKNDEVTLEYDYENNDMLNDIIQYIESNETSFAMN